MIVEFKYSVVHDLMYHILAHMKVENASNLYSETYIDNVNKIKTIFNESSNTVEKTKKKICNISARQME